jgi:hypothetical protein
MERIQPSDEDFAEFERLGSEVSLVEMLEELPDDQREALRAAGVDDDFYLVATPPEWEGGRVNWIDDNGDEGSRGHELLPR